jgi:hypothetical protein
MEIDPALGNAIHDLWTWPIEGLGNNIQLSTAALQFANFTRFIRMAQDAAEANCRVFQWSGLLFVCAISSINEGDELTLVA